MSLTAARRTLAALLVSCLVFAAVAGTARAQPQNVQDGLINVAVFDITVVEGDVVLVLNRVVSDVNVGVAAQIAANVCGVNVGPIAVIGQAVDRSGTTRTACETGQQVVRFSQN